MNVENIKIVLIYTWHCIYNKHNGKSVKTIYSDHI